MRSFRRCTEVHAVVTAALLLGGCASAGVSQERQGTMDWSAVERAIGRRATPQPGGVMRFGMPRGDLRVTVRSGRDTVTIRPAFALGSWLAMVPVDGSSAGRGAVMAMGDLVLAEDEVAPVMRALQAGSVEQTAVHHHVLHESPRVVYMHVHAHGDPHRIAETVRSALALTGTPAEAAPGAPGGDAALSIDTAAVARLLGRGGRMNGGVYAISVPRAETVRDNGMVVPASMGLGTAINFQPTGGGRAAITGDFVLTAPEVNPVIRALQANGIVVTSLHNHLLTDEPRLFFMHFWGVDDASRLARGLRAALDLTNSQPARP